jgi:hypothetical protein
MSFFEKKEGILFGGLEKKFYLCSSSLKSSILVKKSQKGCYPTFYLT